MADDLEWLILVYRIPSEPSRLRATIWRRLKRLGALYLQNSVAALPASSTTERALRTLHHEILEMGGTATLMQSRTLAGGSEVVEAFNAARDDEYEEILDKCRDFRAQVQKEYDEEHFTFAELEENEEDLTKLRKWYEKITARDVLGATKRDQTLTEIDDCERVLEEYANRVYLEENV